MKMKRTVSVSFVAHDGTEFKTKKACEKYESENPEPILSKLQEELERVVEEISCHKHYCSKDPVEVCRTWKCGKMHQESLSLLRLSKPQKGQQRYEYLIELGKLAEEVKRWKHNEKVAYKELLELRARRTKLLNAIYTLKCNSSST